MQVLRKKIIIIIQVIPTYARKYTLNPVQQLTLSCPEPQGSGKSVIL